MAVKVTTLTDCTHFARRPCDVDWKGVMVVMVITVILRGNDGDSGGDVVVVMVVTAMVLLMVRRACFCIGAYDTQLEPKPYDNGDTMSGDEGDGYSDVAGI